MAPPGCGSLSGCWPLCEHIFDVKALRKQVCALAVFVPDTLSLGRRNANPLYNSHQREPLGTATGTNGTNGMRCGIFFPSFHYHFGEDLED